MHWKRTGSFFCTVNVHSRAHTRLFNKHIESLSCARDTISSFQQNEVERVQVQSQTGLDLNLESTIPTVLSPSGYRVLAAHHSHETGMERHPALGPAPQGSVSMPMILEQ